DSSAPRGISATGDGGSARRLQPRRRQRDSASKRIPPRRAARRPPRTARRPPTAPSTRRHPLRRRAPESDAYGRCQATPCHSSMHTAAPPAPESRVQTGRAPPNRVPRSWLAAHSWTPSLRPSRANPRRDTAVPRAQIPAGRPRPALGVNPSYTPGTQYPRLASPPAARHPARAPYPASECLAACRGTSGAESAARRARPATSLRALFPRRRHCACFTFACCQPPCPTSIIDEERLLATSHPSQNAGARYFRDKWHKKLVDCAGRRYNLRSAWHFPGHRKYEDRHGERELREDRPDAPAPRREGARASGAVRAGLAG